MKRDTLYLKHILITHCSMPHNLLPITCASRTHDPDILTIPIYNLPLYKYGAIIAPNKMQ